MVLLFFGAISRFILCTDHFIIITVRFALFGAFNLLTSHN